MTARKGKMSNTRSKNNTTHLIIDVSTSFWTCLKNRKTLNDILDERQIYLLYNSWRRETAGFLKFQSFLITLPVIEKLTLFIILAFRLWPFLAPAVRVLVIETLLPVPHPGTTFTDGKRRIFHYTSAWVQILDSLVILVMHFMMHFLTDGQVTLNGSVSIRLL